ncbi:MAG: polyprenyl synthetase family protein [Oscillospiraceae bacterium]|nr:polyprenyl synthetase family protein [Oscillospiraceae bacterium]
MSNLSQRQQKLLSMIEQKLAQLLPEENELYQPLLDSMGYSLLDGGKRIRPLLTLEFCALCGGEPENALPFGCALEMIHTYSLIHDDLPCMDDDDMRRGRPSNHKAYGEATALLAGDALQALAFAVMLSESSVEKVGAERAVQAAHCLATAAGASGMVGGQVIDLSSEGKKVSVGVLRQMDALKTGALISAACQMGCILGGGTKAQLKAAQRFASNIGLAFQIVDDILDVTSTTEELGKQVGSDRANEKSTYVSELGLEQAKVLSAQLTREAIAALEIFPSGEVKDDVVALAQYLAVRKK